MASPKRPLADISVAMARLGWKSLLIGSLVARIAQLPEPWASRWARPVGPRSCQVECWAPTASQLSTRLGAATSAYQDQSLSKNQWRQHENGCMKKTGDRGTFSLEMFDTSRNGYCGIVSVTS